MADEHDDLQGDWAAQLTARLESFVEVVRNYSVRPALSVVRFLLFGSVALLVGLAVVVVAFIALTRLFDSDVFGGRVWATDLLFGGMLIGAGGFLFRTGVRGKGDADG